MKTELGLGAAILAVTAVLRLGWPGLTEFKADEARLLALALDMAQGQGLALRGISNSVGAPNFPMSVWLYALPVWVWPHVYAATLFTGLLNVLAAAAGYWFVRRYWGARAALAASLMLAASPWAVLFSRKIWAQNLLPLFVMGWGISAALALVERRPKFILLHFLCLAIAIQTHLAAAALLPVTFALLLIFRRRVNWRLVLAGGILATATAVPFFYYLWQNRAQAASLGGLETAGTIDWQSLLLTGQLSLGGDIPSLAGPEAYAEFLKLVPKNSAVQWLWGALIAGGFLVLVNDLRLKIKVSQSLIVNHHSLFIQKRTEAGLLLLFWLLGPALFFLWHNTPLFLHYFIATIPAQYAVAGIGFGVLIDWVGNKRSWGAGLGWALLLGTVVVQTWLIVGLLSFVNKTATPGGFGVPLARQLAAANQAQELFGETKAAEVLVVGPGESPRIDESPAVFDVLLRGVPHRFVDGSQSALFPAEPAVILANGGSASLAVYQETAVAQAEIPLRSGEGSLNLLTLAASSAPAPSVRFESPYLLANWVNLLGYDDPVLLSDGTAVWQIHWRTGDNPDPASYQFFNHLIADGGERVGQADGPAFSPGQWRAGDIVVSRFIIPWPDDALRPFIMRTGMYHYPSLEPVLLLDVAGNPYTDAVEIKLED